jgi:hypothetical protein
MTVRELIDALSDIARNSSGDTPVLMADGTPLRAVALHPPKGWHPEGPAVFLLVGDPEAEADYDVTNDPRD